MPELGSILRALSLAGSRGSALVAQVVVQIAVGALSGPVGLGVLQLFTAWSNVLGEILARGWPTIVLKRVAVAWGRDDRQSGRAALVQARRAICRDGFVGLLVVAGLTLGAWRWFPYGSGIEAAWMLAGLFAAAVAFALMRVGAEGLKGAGAALTAVTLENLAVPATLLVLCLVCILFDVNPSPALLVPGLLLGFAVGAAWAARAVQTRTGRAPVAGPVTESDADRRERRALWFGSVQAIAFLQLPFLVLPLFTDTATIGIYAVAHKLVNVITTLLILLGSVFGPAFARAAADADRPGLRRLLARTQWISVALFAPAAGALLIATNGLGALFHVPSVDLAGFMIILVGGQLANAATGLSGVLLNLTGAARKELRISLAAFVAALVVAAPAGWTYGATGLAVSFSIIIALKNLASWLAARRHIAFGVLTR